MHKKEVCLQEFSLVSFIGKGSYADVTLIKKKDTGKLYALKSLKKKYVAKKKQQNNVMLQRNILTLVDHPFIVKLFYSFQNDRKLFFVLEYCPGGDLFGLLCKRKRLTVPEVRMNAAQIVLALQYLHSKNIVYRDLKPENVIIDEEGYIRLTDFGLSRVQLGQKVLNICGTPEYIAPQVLNKKGASKPADWWCLGCLIYQMSVGLPPFYLPTNRQALFQKIKTTQPKYPASLDPQLRSIIQQFLNKDHETRLGSNGSQQVRSHKFFADINWQQLYNKQVKPKNKTKLNSSVDVSNFDNQFTQCPLQQFSCSPLSNQSLNNNYDGFSYNKSAQNKVFYGNIQQQGMQQPVIIKITQQFVNYKQNKQQQSKMDIQCMIGLVNYQDQDQEEYQSEMKQQCQFQLKMHDQQD